MKSTADLYRVALFVLILSAISGAAFAAGIAWSIGEAHAEEPKTEVKEPRVIYKKKTALDFEGQQLEGEVRRPGEFYFQHRPQEKMDSLVKRRKNFHQEMLRDVVLSK